VEVAIAKISSKGQIVIPSHMRRNLKVGEEFLIIRDQNRFILKKMSKVTEKLKDDLQFAKQVEHAWSEYEKGTFTSAKAADLLKELDKC
jgi:AbrB family looped-hinge helix DNA binding protein